MKGKHINWRCLFLVTEKDNFTRRLCWASHGAERKGPVRKGGWEKAMQVTWATSYRKAYDVVTM